MALISFELSKLYPKIFCKFIAISIPSSTFKWFIISSYALSSAIFNNGLYISFKWSSNSLYVFSNDNKSYMYAVTHDEYVWFFSLYKIPFTVLITGSNV